MTTLIIDAHTSDFAQRCISNAKALLKSASSVMELKHYNIVYHLAVLSLEEMGKASMIMSGAVKTEADVDDKSDKFLTEKTEDHVFKLLWAFWNVDKGSKRILPETFQTAMDLAKHVHQTRTSTLYTAKTPAVIDEATALNMLNLAKASLEIDNTLGMKHITREDLKDFSWFLEAIKDPYNKARIFSKEYFEKYAEFEKLPLWISWIKERFAADDQQMKLLMQQEMNRPEPNGEDMFKAKWKVRTYLFVTGVTKLNQVVLNAWNNHHPRVQFTLDSSNRERLIVDITLPKLVHIQQVHEAVRYEMTNIILTISIGMMSFCWWYNLLPYVEKFEYFVDLENGTRSPYGLKSPYIEVWKKKEKNRSLTDQNVQHMLWCYIMLPKYGENVSRQIYSYYLQDLLDYAKHEAEEPRISRAGIAFLMSLETAMLEYKKITERSQLTKAFFDSFDTLLTDEEDKNLLRSVLEPFSKGEDELCYKAMTADAATKVKIFCDLYLLENYKKRIAERMRDLQPTGLADETVKEIGTQGSSTVEKS